MPRFTCVDDGVVNISCKGSIIAVDVVFVELTVLVDGNGNDGSSKYLYIDINLIEYDEGIPKPNKSGGFATTVGVAIDVAEGNGVIDDWIVGVERSLPACRTGFLFAVGAANGFNFGMLLLTFFSA